MVNPHDLRQRMADIQENANRLQRGLEHRRDTVTRIMPVIEKAINDYNASVDDVEKQIDAITVGSIGITLLINVFINIANSMAEHAKKEGSESIPLSEFFEDVRDTFAAVIVSSSYPKQEEHKHVN